MPAYNSKVILQLFSNVHFSLLTTKCFPVSTCTLAAVAELIAQSS